MRHSMLLGYQWMTGAAEAGAGVLLYLAPALTLRMMGMSAPTDARPYVSYIGAFVLSVGLSCIYGAWLLQQEATPERLETVWLLTAFVRSAVAIYVIKSVLTGELETPWLVVAAFDGVCAAVQGVGLRRRWLAKEASSMRAQGARIRNGGFR